MYCKIRNWFVVLGLLGSQGSKGKFLQFYWRIQLLRMLFHIFVGKKQFICIVDFNIKVKKILILALKYIFFIQNRLTTQDFGFEWLYKPTVCKTGVGVANNHLSRNCIIRNHISSYPYKFVEKPRNSMKKSMKII